MKFAKSQVQSRRPPKSEHPGRQALTLDEWCDSWIASTRTQADDSVVKVTARPATGLIIEHVGRAGRITRTLRFFADGRKRTITLGAVTCKEAEQRLARELAQVERGRWRPSEPAITSPVDAPSFRSFAEEWWMLHRGQLSQSTLKDYRGRLDKHLIDFFGPTALDGITAETVARYVRHKLGENERIRAADARGEPIMEFYTSGSKTRLRRARPLSPRSINMTILLLGQIMELAIERDLIERNPAHDRRCRLLEHRPASSYVEDVEGLAALFEAATNRAVVALLCFAGLRVGELCELRWCSVDIAAGWLTIEDATSDAGIRRVRMRGVVRDELAAIRPADVDPDTHVFVTRRGSKLSRTSVAARYINPAVAAANATLTEQGLPTLPHLTPRSLRKTFATVLYALGESPAVVMREMGHTSSHTALAIYARAMRRSHDENLALRTLVEGAEFRHAIRATDTRLSTEWPTSLAAPAGTSA